MGNIIITAGSPDNITEDIHILSRQWGDSPEITLATDKDARNRIVQAASALFTPDNAVFVLLDPPWELVGELKEHLYLLKERFHVIIYTTSQLPAPLPIQGEIIALEQEKKKRLRQRVLKTLKVHGKQMTDKAFQLFSDLIKDESVLELELAKLVNYIGERKRIDSKDVRAVITDTHEESMLDLFQAFSAGEKQQVLNVFENLVTNGTPVLAVFSFLIRQVRLLLHAKDMEEVLKSGADYALFQKAFGKWKGNLETIPSEKRHYLPYQKPYYAYKLSATSKKVSRRDLIAFYGMLSDFDIRVKKGTKHDRIQLERALLET
jgi:DNA polymerase III delta subunit